MFLRWIQPYYSADDGGGSGGDDDQGGGKVKPSDILNRYGQTAESVLRIAEELAKYENRNWNLREANRKLAQERDDLKEKVPGEDSAVLPKADAQELEQYRALGSKPSELKSALEVKATAEGELSGLKREKMIGKAAEAVGFKASVLTTLVGDLDIQTKAGADGKQVAVVVADGKETPLADYAAQAWADFMPALAPKAASGDGVGSPANGQRPKTAGDLLMKPRALI